MNFQKKRCVAMLLAGGQGSRLLVLTENTAKPAVPFGGKYRIIDFPLSNCVNSGIDTVGILTQYQPLELNEYIGNGQPWGLNRSHGGVQVLPPYARSKKSEWYKGTANAIYQNIAFIERYDPDNVLVLSGDHIYRMDYRKMLRLHKEKNADLTVAVMRVPLEQASAFGVMTLNEDGRITAFEEKPKKPASDLVSMGIYIFNAETLEKALLEDSSDPASEHDFGKNIIPTLLAQGKRLYGYEFSGFWKDVGTIASYHETSMDLLEEHPQFELDDPEFPIFSNENISPPQYVGPEASVENSLIGSGCRIYGTVQHSVIGVDCIVEEGAVVKDSVLLSGTVVHKNAAVTRAILGEGTTVEADAVFGNDNGEIVVTGDDFVIE